MVSERQAQEIKRTYCSASDLEAVGIFPNEEATLTPEEKKALEFINRLDQQQAGNLIHFLGNVESLREKGAEEVFSDQRYERDVARLQEQGLDIDDQQSLAFAYQILSEKLQGSEGHLGDFARMKALSHTGRVILPQPEGEKPVSLATLSLQDMIERETQRVERFLTQYFQLVDSIIQDFLPLTMEVEGKDEMHHIKLEAISSEKKDFWSLTGGDNHRIKRNFNRQRYHNGTFSPTDNSPDKVSCPACSTPYIGLTMEKQSPAGSPHLKDACYGLTIEWPLTTSKDWERKATAQFTIPRRFSGKKQREIRSLARHLFVYEMDRLSYNSVIAKVGVVGLEKLRIYCPELEKYQANNTLGYLRKGDTITIEIYERDLGNWNRTASRTPFTIFDEERAKRTEKPLFWFSDFDAKTVNFSRCRQVWEALHLYAKLPAALTACITKQLQENFIEVTMIPLDDLVHQTHEQLGYLRQTIQEVQAKGLLTAEPTAKLIEEAIES